MTRQPDGGANAPDPLQALDYAGFTLGKRSAPGPAFSRAIVLASLSPIPVFFLLLFARKAWSRWLMIGQRWEILTGELWMITAAWCLACAIAFTLRGKRWDVWVALSLHAAFLVFTVFPGSVAIPWLMHWMSGPGA